MSYLKVGISSYADMKARTLAVARGEYEPRPDQPKVWFTSIESFAKVLSDRNRALLNLIVEEEPTSLTELARLSGRAKSNLSRTLHTLERYGVVHLEKGHKGRILPRVPYSNIVLEMPIVTAVGDSKRVAEPGATCSSALPDGVADAHGWYGVARSGMRDPVHAAVTGSEGRYVEEPNPHPGEILLEDFLRPMQISQSALARAVGVPPRRINEIVLGKRAVTAGTDLLLTRYFGLSEGLFLRLQTTHDIENAKVSLSDRLTAIRPCSAA